VINRDFADVKTTMAGMGYAVLGTATGRGDNRAMDAAVAAMASPLLEAGAIDGARGILINITGSSNLKLSEVNEASTIIQNAAHEDCNIIFGAVQDERMGDEVKITVIATGFKQEMPERRARMLAESTLPGADYQVPIRMQSGAQNGRSAGARASETAPMFASEEREGRQMARPVEAAQQIAMPLTKAEAAAPVDEDALACETEAQQAEEMPETDWVSVWSERAEAPSAEAEASPDAGESIAEEEGDDLEREPELVPVSASVFDDEFFRAGYVRSSQAEAVGAAEPVHEAKSFAAANGTQAEADELDIPAFLRRSR